MREIWTKAACAFLISATNAMADQVLERIEVKTTPEKAWAAIGDFCGIKEWHPAVASCELEGYGKTQIRTLILKDGAKIVEKEVAWNDLGRAYSYKILESPLPVESYLSTLKVLPIDQSKINFLWTSSYKPIGPASEAKKIISDIYVAGLKTLKERLKSEPK